MKIVIAIILILWIYSMFRFSKEQKFFKRVCRYYEYKHRQNPNDVSVSMGLASAYMKTQKYKKAYDIYEKLESKGVAAYPGYGESLQANKEFCRKPFPGCNGPKDFNGSWWHNFKLVRLGGRRRYDFNQDHMLEAESMMRQGII